MECLTTEACLALHIPIQLDVWNTICDINRIISKQSSCVVQHSLIIIRNKPFVRYRSIHRIRGTNEWWIKCHTYQREHIIWIDLISILSFCPLNRNLVIPECFIHVFNISVLSHQSTHSSTCLYCCCIPFTISISDIIPWNLFRSEIEESIEDSIGCYWIRIVYDTLLCSFNERRDCHFFWCIHKSNLHISFHIHISSSNNIWSFRSSDIPFEIDLTIPL